MRQVEKPLVSVRTWRSSLFILLFPSLAFDLSQVPLTAATKQPRAHPILWWLHNKRWVRRRLEEGESTDREVSGFAQPTKTKTTPLPLTSGSLGAPSPLKFPRLSPISQEHDMQLIFFFFPQSRKLFATSVLQKHITLPPVSTCHFKLHKSKGIQLEREEMQHVGWQVMKKDLRCRPAPFLPSSFQIQLYRFSNFYFIFFYQIQPFRKTCFGHIFTFSLHSSRPLLTQNIQSYSG